MKKFRISVLLAVLLCFSVCMGSCNENQIDDSEQVNNEDYVLYDNLADFLSTEQIDLYIKAQKLYPLFVGVPDGINTLHLTMNGADTQTVQEFLVNSDYPQNSLNINGLTYHMCIGEYQKLSDFKKLCLSVFTLDYFEQLNDTGRGIPTFVEIDQHLYYAFTSKGSAFGYNPLEYPDKYELIKCSDNEILFNIIGHYKSSNVDPVYTVETRSFPVSIVLTENGWRFNTYSDARLSD